MFYKIKFYVPAPETQEKYKAITQEFIVDVNGKGFEQHVGAKGVRYGIVTISR
jgi:hypothetical protein